jgi:outer membrane receptor protein involved in Fe transport
MKQRTIPTVADDTISGIILSPPKFKARAGLSWRRGGWSAASFVNFISGETDTGVNPNFEIASWTTVDANIAYRFSRDAREGKGLTISLAATNLLDKSPPRAVSPQALFAGIYFDSANYSVVGRFIGVTLSKAWSWQGRHDLSPPCSYR